MFLNLQHPNIRYIAPPVEGGSDTPDATPPAEPNGNGEEIDWEAKYKEALGHSQRLGKEGQGQQGRRRRAGKAQGIPDEQKPTRPPSARRNSKRR